MSSKLVASSSFIKYGKDTSEGTDDTRKLFDFALSWKVNLLPDVPDVTFSPLNGSDLVDIVTLLQVCEFLANFKQCFLVS